MAMDDIAMLFAQTLEGGPEDDAPWDAVTALRLLGTREVFEYARSWVESDDPRKRARGIDVLALLGQTVEHPSHSFPEESYDVVSQALGKESELGPMLSAIAALGHLRDLRAVPLIAPFHSHPNSEIRFSLAHALGGYADDALGVETLLILMRDPDGRVRDWATFGLGVQGDADSVQIREALCQRLGDSNLDGRQEAIAGLAKRQDMRALQPLLGLLDQDFISPCMEEAASLLLGIEVQAEWFAPDYATALRQRFASGSAKQ
jgi:HEAT repeat protein